MTEKSNAKVEALPDLDDLLQCPVCYEIPSGQIFQCNEGHHVCGRCKMRLDVCPVCRAFFFGTRNYAMEELIANVRKLQAFKLGGKVTTGQTVESSSSEKSSSEDNESANENEEEEEPAQTVAVRAPSACKGLFRCLCCKNNPERLPAARLLNHLRYYHSPDLIEGRTENDEYLQAWQFPTIPGRIVTAVRVSDMGIFFLIIEITDESVHSWMQMAASPWVSSEFYYTFTLSGNDREAIFSDCVWSVRSCEGSLKKRGRCLSVLEADARALLQPAAMCGKLSLRRTPRDLMLAQSQPRAVLRVANRSRAPDSVSHALGPFLQDLRNDVARLSRAFATLGQEASALRTEAERARPDPAPRAAVSAPAVAARAPVTAQPPARAPVVAQPPARAPVAAAAPAPRPAVAPPPAVRSAPSTQRGAATQTSAAPRPAPVPAPAPAPRAQEPVAPPPQMSRREARRMRYRVGVALDANDVPEPRRAGEAPASRTERPVELAARANNVRPSGDAAVPNGQISNAPGRAPAGQNTSRNVSANNLRASSDQPARLQNVRATSGVSNVVTTGYLAVSTPSVAPPPVVEPPQPVVTNGNNSRNKRRRRNRR